MKWHPDFSLTRFWAMVVKEFVQMRRDRLTFMMMIGIPLLQLVLFGFAINSDPRNLPTAVLMEDDGPYGRTLLKAIQNSSYYEFVRQVKTEQEAHDALARGEVQFVVTIPEDFSRDLVRGDRPVLLIEADATDRPPPATPSGLCAICSTPRCRTTLPAPCPLWPRPTTPSICASMHFTIRRPSPNLTSCLA